MGLSDLVSEVVNTFFGLEVFFMSKAAEEGSGSGGEKLKQKAAAALEKERRQVVQSQAPRLKTM